MSVTPTSGLTESLSRTHGRVIFPDGSRLAWAFVHAAREQASDSDYQAHLQSRGHHVGAMREVRPVIRNSSASSRRLREAIGHSIVFRYFPDSFSCNGA